MAENLQINTANFSMLLTDESGNMSPYKDFTFISLDILETLNSLPYYILTIKPNTGTDTAERIQRVHNFKLTYNSDKLNYISYLGVDELKNSAFQPENTITVTGWLTKQENFRQVNTRYLANNVKTALSKLDIVTGDIKIKGNPNFDIFQINKTNIETALSLCRTSAETPLWSIGRYSINLSAAADDPKYQDITPAFGTVYQSPDNMYVLWRKNRMNYKSTRPSGGSIIKSLGSPNNFLISSAEDECFNNYLKNQEFWNSRLCAMSVTNEDTEFLIPLGTKVKNRFSSLSGIDTWIVGSCYYHYNIQSAPSTTVQYIGIPSGTLTEGR